METDSTPNKVEAIYQLREAVEAKAHAERVLETDRSPAARDALLEALLAVEAKTQDAIEICEACGHRHGAAEEHRSVTGEPGSNVIRVDFRPESPDRARS